VSRLGRELHERLGVFTGHFAGVGKSLDAAVSNYNKAVGSLESRVLVSARKFPELGVGGDELPDVVPVTTQSRPLLAEPDSFEEPALAGPSLDGPSLEGPSLERPSLERPSLESLSDEEAGRQTVLELPPRADAA
jgi:DNA recombination protein RmuC